MPSGSGGTPIVPTTYTDNASLGPELLQFPDGLQVEMGDLMEGNDTIRRLSALALAMITGNLSFLPSLNPVTVVPNAFGVDVGTLGQTLFIQGRMANCCPKVTLPLNAADGALARQDIVAVRYQQITDVANPKNGRNIEQNSMIVPNQTVFKILESWDVQYVVGLAAADPVDPVTPDGYVALARIHVKAAAVSLAAVDIEMIFPTVGRILAALTGADRIPANIVTTINDKQGDVKIEALSGLSVDNSVPGKILIGESDTDPFVGFTVANFCRIVPGTATTLELDAPLPGGQSAGYRLYARASTMSNDNINLVGGGSGDTSHLTWETGQLQANLPTSVEPVALLGVCGGGCNPHVVATPAGAASTPPSHDNVLQIWAVCVAVNRDGTLAVPPLPVTPGLPPDPPPAPGPPAPPQSAGSTSINAALVVAGSGGTPTPPGTPQPPEVINPIPDYQCPAVDQAIETRERGFVRAGDLMVGDHLRAPETGGWNKVLDVKIQPDDIYRILLLVKTEFGAWPWKFDSVDVNAGHLFRDAAGAWLPIREIPTGHALVDGEVYFIEATLLGPGEFAAIKCENQEYVLQGTTSHNLVLHYRTL